MTGEALFQLALCRVEMLGPVRARILVENFGSASAIFSAKLRDLERIEGIGTAAARKIKNFRDFAWAEQEHKFLEKNKIEALFFSDAGYPARLKNCYDPPTLLFIRGKMNLNTLKILGIVGTRHHSDYGRKVTENLVAGLSKLKDLLIISGLAMGIDAIAHNAAVKNNLPTVGVLAHGLDTIYPEQHAGLAKSMLSNGGLITEFPSRTKPDRHNFPSRNRIVAGLCDALVVVETAEKGGSMITADLAIGYDREVFAIPGCVIDARSAGCNLLIRQNRAGLLTDADQLIDQLGWNEKKLVRLPRQTSLFPKLTVEEQTLYELLREKGTLSIDQLADTLGLRPGALSGTILSLEMNNLVETLPGKLFRVCG